MNNRSGPFDVIGQLAALRRYALSLVRNADEAEDLVNDALVRAYEHQNSFRRGGNIRQWLFSILHNTHVDSLRRRRSAARRDALAADLVDPVIGAEQEHVVRLAQGRRAFLDLPEEQRQALHLVAIEELSYQEAADGLNIPVGTLMSRLARARARLRELEMTDAGRRALPPPVEKPAQRGQGGSKPVGLRIVGGSDDTSS
ncbi:sigma-70 family RNA polymerase sigma factor [Agrobacterium vitis]|uniref:sigma-70 family RNA polymerase sigma factor n=1 Tax=Agrobacterium vitis TaxID=373 RepID=UPI0020363666|nr:sigma-70 family RNA polymerase sigma factor [Agrobacterium vitis]MCM2453366.1 sigma-70 family RNA polymerase sigma factor [Agrobacterium vitis]